MVENGPPFAQPHGQRHLAVAGIAVDVAHVIDVEHGGGQQAAHGGGQYGQPAQALGMQIEGSQYAQQPKKHEHRHIPQPTIAIRFAAQPHGVSDGRQQGRGPQQHEYQPAAQVAAKSDEQQRQPRYGRRQPGEQHAPAHGVWGQ